MSDLNPVLDEKTGERMSDAFISLSVSLGGDNWHLIPHWIIDRSKYRGKGRPRKIDYRLWPGESDLVYWPKNGLYDLGGSHYGVVSVGS